jgi:hypothetical protein
VRGVTNPFAPNGPPPKLAKRSNMAGIRQAPAGATDRQPGPAKGFSLRRYHGWQIELDLRSLKRTMQMDVLRCKTPERVRKEIWAHILAYNLIRTIIAQAASKHGIDPRSISFKGALQTLEAFQPVIALQGEQDSAFRRHLYQQLLEAIASQRVADRPDRYEPRLRKRRPKHYGFLRKPRHETKRDMRNGFSEN